MTDCTAKIRPFIDGTEFICCLPEHGSNMEHKAILKEHTYPGSLTEVFWFESDRRNFRGDWYPCGFNCTLPKNHRGACTT